MVNAKQKVESLILEIEKGNIDPMDAWNKIKKLKKTYVQQYSEQSWHVYIGNRFQKVIYSILKGYFNRLKSQDRTFENLSVFSENEIEGNEIIQRKLAIKYGKYLLLPDTDIAIVDYNRAEPWKSVILAIISCKTSLRERIAQACYWKLKLLSSDVTKNVRVFLATTDNDEDFFLRDKGGYNGRHRNRVIAEYELDGVYILREDFKEMWESSKIKRYERIFNDLIEIFKNAHKNCF
ncbi:MAG: BsaWI family type II restriction enzyme [candidate division WOR-3 bacterium]